MIQQITIENFKSLKKVTLDLKEVNLLIGANNSGKSNFLKAIDFFKDVFRGHSLSDKLSRSFYVADSTSKRLSSNRISFHIHGTNKDGLLDFYRLEILPERGDYSFRYLELYGTGKLSPNNFHNFQLRGNLNRLDTLFEEYTLNVKHCFAKELEGLSGINLDDEKGPISDSFGRNARLRRGLASIGGLVGQYGGVRDGIDSIAGSHIYMPDPVKLLAGYPITGDKLIYRDCSNLVSFLDTMRDANVEVVNQINSDLSKCIPDFKRLIFDLVNLESTHGAVLKSRFPGKSAFKKLGLEDIRGNRFFADELSEGTLYFICLLSIINQPDPPNLILLEEPDKGIHPRRIKEIIGFIQQLAEEKGVQFILTSHHPIVLDEFAHDPASVFVFDKANDATEVKNLETDIINERNNKIQQAGLEPIDYTEELSENWLMGLLDGVPND